MIWLVLGAVYVIGFVVVAAALRQDSLEMKPKATAVVVVLWPGLIALAVLLVLALVGRWAWDMLTPRSARGR